MKFFHAASVLVLLFSYCVMANGVNLNGKIFIHCPEKLHIPDSRDQVLSYIEANFFSGKLNRLLLEQRKIGFQYQIPKPGVYGSVGGTLKFFSSEDVKSLVCEYFGPGGVDGEVTISIKPSVPFSVMTEAELNTREPVDCLPVSADNYGGIDYIPCVLTPEFSQIVSHGPALEVVEQWGTGAHANQEVYAITVAKHSGTYHLSALDRGEKKDISFLCSDSGAQDTPLYIKSSQQLLYEFVLEPYGQSSYLICYKNGEKMKSMFWRGGGYDYAGSKHSHQQKTNYHRDSEKSRNQNKGDSRQSKAKYEWGKGWYQSGNGSDYGWRQWGYDQNKRRQNQNAPSISLLELVSSRIVYFSAFFGMGDFAYQMVGGGPVEDAFAELGLPMYRADLATIKKQCRNIKKQHHPDKGGTAERFHYYTEKCETLVNAVKWSDALIL